MSQEVNCGQLYQLKLPLQFFIWGIDSFLIKKKGSGLLSLQFSLRIRKRSLQGYGQREKKKHNLIMNYQRWGKKVVMAIKTQTAQTKCLLQNKFKHWFLQRVTLSFGSLECTRTAIRLSRNQIQSENRSHSDLCWSFSYILGTFQLICCTDLEKRKNYQLYFGSGLRQFHNYELGQDSTTRDCCL